MAARIHQTLHGYSDGHRLIAGSLSASGPDARAMLVMSDLSGPGIRPGPEGYLTGYPLGDGGRYVLARTWAAPEMPRPGCVWTHSLIIDNADVAALTCADGMLAAFRRPGGPRETAEYSEPIALPVASTRALGVLDGRTAGLLEALYTNPDRMVIADAGAAEDDDRLVTAIWMQQWPRLRRTFGFCTLAGIDRSSKGVPLALQLVRSTDRDQRTSFPDAVAAVGAPEGSALAALTADIEGRDETRVREFLRRTGGDVEGGRRAMLPLCRLHSSLFTGHRPDLSAAVRALADLDALGTRQARSVRTLVARAALNEVDKLDDEVFEFLVAAVGQDAPGDGMEVPAARIGAALWQRTPSRFFETLDAVGSLGESARAALAGIAVDELVDGLAKSPTLAPRVAAARPDVLEREDFWAIAEVSDGLAAAADAGNAGSIALAVAASGRTGPALRLVEQAGPDELAAALDAAERAGGLPAWANAMVADRGRTAAVLASGKIRSRLTLVGVAKSIGLDDVPNDFGDDPWAIASANAGGKLGRQDEDFFAAYLMTRGLGTRSRSEAQLIRLSYTTLYRALQQDRLRGEVARMAKSRLDWQFWPSWDLCSRLRETVVSRFVERRLDPETFGRLTDDGDLATSLIDEAAYTGRGRRYLAEVRKCLKGAREKAIRARADYILAKIR